jgi:hypothetical protein
MSAMRLAPKLPTLSALNRNPAVHAAPTGLAPPGFQAAVAESRLFTGDGLGARNPVQLLLAVFIVMAAFELWLLDWSRIVFRAGDMMNRPAAEAAELGQNSYD